MSGAWLSIPLLGLGPWMSGAWLSIPFLELGP
jgi:hypothetical protein